MKISIGFGNAIGLASGDEQKAVELLHNAGFNGIDYPFCSFARDTFASSETQKTILRQAELFKKAGIVPTQSHLHYIGGEYELTIEQYTEQLLPSYLKAIEYCGMIGCPVAVAHLYFEKDAEQTYRKNVMIIEKLLPSLEKYHVALGIENIFGGGILYSPTNVNTSAEIMRYIDTFRSPYVGACLDTGHAKLTKQDPIEMIHAYGKHLIGLHMNTNTNHDMHMLPGIFYSWMDSVNYTEVSKALKESGYAGAYNLEVAVGGWPAEIKAKIGQSYFNMAYCVASYYAGLIEN